MSFTPPQQIQTDRLKIRALEERDLTGIFACYNNEDVQRYCPPTRWRTMEQAHSWFARMQPRIEEGNAMQFVIELTDAATIIGTCVLFKIDAENKRAEIGYALGKEFWGYGYMHEALSALIDCAFRVLALHRLEAEIDPRNTGSAQSLTRLGFEHEGTLRERWIDAVEISDSGLYGLLNRDWAARR